MLLLSLFVRDVTQIMELCMYVHDLLRVKVGGDSENHVEIIS